MRTKAQRQAREWSRMWPQDRELAKAIHRYTVPVFAEHKTAKEYVTPDQMAAADKVLQSMVGRAA